MNAGIIWKALAMIARIGATKIERIGSSTAKSCGTTVVIALRKFWDNARDFHDHIFDDRWWGAYGWGVGWAGHYPVNPWRWWAPAASGAAAAFVDGITPDPIYIDYGMN